MIKKITVALIRWYRKDLSKRKRKPCCRFRPTCSAYAQQAVEEYGVMKGLYLSLKRILACHPYGRQGIDPVPIRHRKKGACQENIPNPDRGYQILSLIDQPKNRKN